MALNKKIDNKFGTDTNYWRIGSMIANCNDVANITVILDGYISEQDYIGSKEKIDEKIIKLELNKAFTGNLFEKIYQSIKKMPDFKDAEDLL